MFEIDKEKLGAFIAQLSCLFVCCIELLLMHLKSVLNTNDLIYACISAFFGGYFCMFAKPKLPTYYDENKINIYSDGIFRMNMPRVSFNKSNWPHVLQVIRCLAVFSMIGYPILSFVLTIFLPAALWQIGSYGLLLLYLAGLFVPVYYVGRKYQ